MGLLLLMGGGSRGPRVSDAYDPNEFSTWYVGNTISVGATYDGVGAFETGVQMEGHFTRLNVTPGVYLVNGFEARLAFLQSACDLIEVKICKLVGSNLEVVWSYDVTNQKPAVDSSVSATFTIPDQSVTIESGVSYWFGSVLRATSGRSVNQPGWRLTTGVSTDIHYQFITSVGISTWPTTFTPTALTAGTQYHQRIKLKTKNRIVYTNSSASVGSKPLIPVRVDGLTSVKFDSAIVTNGQNLDLKFLNTANATLETVTLDFVNDDIEIAGTTQSLTGQDGHTFDLLGQFNHSTSRTNVLYLNRTSGQGGQGSADIATISHAAKNANTRGSSYSKAIDYSWLSVEGTGTLAKIEVGYEPVIIFGDSMSAFTSGRLGVYLPTGFTEDRMFWRAQISGNRLAVTAAGIHTAGYLRYKNTTIGLGDLCELRDVVFCFGLYGLNDISRIGFGTSVATATSEYFTQVESIVDDLLANGNQPLLVGLAPYHDSVNAQTEEAQAIIDWNRRYATLATEKRVAWINVWYDLVDKATLGDPIPKILSAYTSDGGVHINEVATQAIVPLIVEAYESGIVGGPWDENKRRYRY